MSKLDPKTHLMGHSEAKVTLLSEYLTRYLNIISNDGYTKCIKIYDLFSGVGIYKNSGKGSPIVTLEAIQALRAKERQSEKSNPIQIDCYFNDIEKDKIEMLSANISKYFPSVSLDTDLTFTSRDYSSEIIEISKSIASLKNTKVFIFIDPYGYKDIRISDIKKLIDLGNTEVLLFLPIQFMLRFKINGTPISLKDFMNELTNEEEELKEPRSATEFVYQLRDLSRKYLGDSNFVDTFLITKDSNTVFSLFFFCSHIRAFEKMLESKWEIDSDYGRGWQYNIVGESLFDPMDINPLEKMLVSYLSAKDRTNGDIYEYSVRQGFLPKHAREVLTGLQKNGRIEAVAKDKKNLKKGIFYIPYEHYRNEPDKITISLK